MSSPATHAKGTRSMPALSHARVGISLIEICSAVSPWGVLGLYRVICSSRNPSHLTTVSRTLTFSHWEKSLQTEQQSDFPEETRATPLGKCARAWLESCPLWSGWAPQAQALKSPAVSYTQGFRNLGCPLPGPHVYCMILQVHLLANKPRGVSRSPTNLCIG